MNGKDGRIYRTASLKIKLAGPVVKPKGIQKVSGLAFTKERRDKEGQLRRQEDKTVQLTSGAAYCKFLSLYSAHEIFTRTLS